MGIIKMVGTRIDNKPGPPGRATWSARIQEKVANTDLITCLAFEFGPMDAANITTMCGVLS